MQEIRNEIKELFEYCKERSYCSVSSKECKRCRKLLGKSTTPIEIFRRGILNEDDLLKQFIKKEP